MPKKVKTLKNRVFFDASVILAGLKSPNGGSAKVLKWAESEKIEAFASEIVISEVKGNLKKLALKSQHLKDLEKYIKITPAPEKLPIKYQKIVKEIGDIHLFVSAELINTNYLVSLDKRHVLSLAEKIKIFRILLPGELIKEVKSQCIHKL